MERMNATETISRMRHGKDVGIAELADAVRCDRDRAQRAIYAAVKRGELVKVRHGKYRRNRPRAGQERVTVDDTSGSDKSNAIKAVKSGQRRSPNGRSPKAKRHSFGDYHPDDVVSRKIAAALIGVSPRTTEDWAREGKGPVYCKLGTGRSARIVYRVRSLLAFLDSQMITTPCAGGLN